jgi:AGZA family xanthine/uracil permease-like MFS transporter
VGAIETGLITVIFVFFFLDLFDTMGTLIGVSGPAGFLKGDRLPRANRAMLSDAVGTVGGALLGTSTITSYVESATGIEHGAKTGLANIFTSFLFLLALFFSPLAEMFGGEYVITIPGGGGEAALKEIVLRPVVAPALIIVGYLMLKCVTRIKWDDITEAIPAYLTIIMMPLSGITDGIAFGFISFSLLKLVSGKGKEVHWLIYLFAVLFIIKYIIS